jgi:hypothetical protein
MRLTGGAKVGTLHLRRYQHQRHGVVETLTQNTVVYVRPVFGMLKPDEEQQPGNHRTANLEGKGEAGHVDQSQEAPHRAR